MRITKISVKGLFGMFDHEIPLNQESRITIIHGPNGVGKTVLMRIVHSLFHYEYEYIGSIPFESCSLQFDNGGILNIHRISDGDVLLAANLEEEGCLVNPPFEVKLTAEHDLYEEAERLLPDSRYVEGAGSSLLEVEEERSLFGDDSPPVKATRRLTRAGLLDEYPQLHTKVYGKMPDWFSHIRKETNSSLIQTQRLVGDDISFSELEESKRLNEFGEDFHFPHPELAVERFRRHFWRNISAHETMVHELEVWQRLKESFEAEAESLTDADYIPTIPEDTVELWLSGRQQQLQEFRQAIVGGAENFPLTAGFLLFMDILNERCLFKSLIIEDGTIAFRADNGRDVPMSALSSGEQQLLVLYYQLLFETEPNTLVMIDEPELSMNVVWQRNFLKDLQRIIELLKFDVLIATHSPQIIHDKWDWVVHLGEKVDD